MREGEKKNQGPIMSQNTQIWDICAVYFTLCSMLLPHLLLFLNAYFFKDFGRYKHLRYVDLLLLCIYRVVFKYPYYFRLVTLVTGSIGQPGFNQPIKTVVL